MVFKSTICPVSIMSCIKEEESKTNGLTEEVFIVTHNFGQEKFKKCMKPFLL